MLGILDKSKGLAVSALFALCVAPTFISYQPYRFRWDDSDYFQRSIAVSQAFWTGNVHGLGAMVSVRPPAMTLLGLPWGPLTSWDSAGKCFITLTALISLLAVLCLYLLLRIGLKPVFLVAASLCVFAAIGPYPRGANAHVTATAFLSDSLFAWTVLAAVLLIPYEARTHCSSIRGAVVRGIFWGSILSLGAMTKVSFFCFIVLIVPALFMIRLRNSGVRPAFAAFISFACCSMPSAFYLLRWGRPAFSNAKLSSFGGLADFYYTPLLQFLDNNIRASPGLMLSFAFVIAALLYIVIKKRTVVWSPDFMAVLIVMGFSMIVLASTNREIRFSFPVIVALPFLTAILMSGTGNMAPGRSAAFAAGLIFCCLLMACVPTRHRADREQSLGRSEGVLAQVARCNAKRIVLATDSPTLNGNLMNLAIEVSEPRTSFQVDTLAYPVSKGRPIEEDFRVMSKSDEVIFQDRDALSPPYTNRRASEYERYLRQGGYASIRVADDVTVYAIRCTP